MICNVIAASLILGLSTIAAYSRDWSVNPPPMNGWALLQTIPGFDRREHIEIMASCPAGIRIVLDELDIRSGQSMQQTIVPITGAANFNQGGVWFQGVNGHKGRIRIYSTDSTCFVSAWEWP